MLENATPLPRSLQPHYSRKTMILWIILAILSITVVVITAFIYTKSQAGM